METKFSEIPWKYGTFETSARGMGHKEQFLSIQKMCASEQVRLLRVWGYIYNIDRRNIEADLKL